MVEALNFPAEEDVECSQGSRSADSRSEVPGSTGQQGAACGSQGEQCLLCSVPSTKPGPHGGSKADRELTWPEKKQGVIQGWIRK